ncbi:MAG TPA: alpha/beta fold hydrolase [Actinomycetales bacterium]|nr:alpha/beta fold hydrolase [Actinomycetales bacterium]
MSTVSIDGITVGYDDEGSSGEPLVLIHGHPFDRSMWRPQVEHFSRSGWRVIAPDLRGYGGSTVVPGKTTLERFARDIAALLDHLEVDEVILGGLSMGGQIVLEFHRLFPRRVRGLVLADTSAAAESEEGKKLRNDTADRLLREGMARYADEMLPKMVAPHNVQALPAVAQHVLRMMRGTSPEGAAAALRGRAERPDYLEMLPRIAVPTLVVVGRDDEFTPVRDAEVMYERIPNATLMIIERAGHMPNLERQAEFNVAVERFLTSVSTTPVRKR